MASVATLLLAGTCLGHDFWIRPSTMRPARDTVIGATLLVGDHFPGDPYPRKESGIESFTVTGPDGQSAPVVGREAKSPAGLMRFGSDGLWVVAYRGKRNHVELESAKFEGYLKDKGLEKVSESRAKAGESEKPGREVFSRCAKSLVIVGEPDQASSRGGFDRVIGQRLELVPRTDPTLVSAGGSVSVKLLFEGKPLSGALVIARCEQDDTVHASGRTDADGAVTLEVARGGVWMVTAVEMVRLTSPLPAPEAEADWESLWASLTFATADAGASVALADVKPGVPAK